MTAVDPAACDEYVDRLLGWVEETISPAELEEVDRHLAGCPACTAYVELIEDAVCEEIQRQIDPYLDRELSGDDLDRVQRHLAVCERCTNRFQFDGSVLHYMQARTRDGELPAPVAERILHGVRSRISAV